MSTEKKRLQYVDAIKGIAIAVIVFYHLLAPCGAKNVINHLMDPLLASFFILSGYFYRPGKRTLGANLKNRMKSLMTPFFRYSLFFWVVGTVYLVATRNETIKEGFLCLRNFFAGCIWNRVIQNWFGWEYYSLGKRYFYLADFWFLLAMLFASILFFLIADKVLRSKAATLVTAVVLFAATGLCKQCGVDLPYNLQLVPYWTGLMLLGAFAGGAKLIECDSFSKGFRWAAGLAALAAGIVISMVKEPSFNQFRGSFGGSNEVVTMLLCLVTAILVVWGLSEVFLLAEEAGLRLREVAWLGSHSLLIYLYHMFFAWIISVITGFSIFYEETVPGKTVFLSFLLTLACLALGILRNVVEDKIKSKGKGA